MNRRILAIILAVVLAALGTTGVLMYVNKADARAMEGQEPVTVLVAKEPIPAGTTAKDAKVSLVQETMPAGSVPANALSEIDTSLNEMVTSTNIAQGELLTRRMLIKKSAANEVVLPKGKLAVSIPVEGAEEAGSQFRAGFKVAVFDTFNAKKGAYGETHNGERPLTFYKDALHSTRLVLAKVEVISVIAEKDKTEKGSRFGKFLVTVAVTQEQAEKLIHALHTGVVSLAQVNDGSKVAPSPGIDNNTLFRQRTSED